MITGETSSGFKFSINEECLDDWELIDYLTEMDDGNYAHIARVPERLLGKDQAKELKEHLREESGRVSAKKMVEALAEIFTEANSLKNS